MSTPDMLSKAQHQIETVTFEPTRLAGLERLEEFVSRTGAHYSSQRHYDFGSGDHSGVSALLAWIKHRLITEEEIIAKTLTHHNLSTSMKFIQEVFWRSYFKGWMQQHPSVWRSYQNNLELKLESLESDKACKANYDEAIDGRTGIACFDHWCSELKSKGYLHNHARMWFASIWIFTLRLPWELGADFFLTHLIDGDAAANTLSWRWVGGLHTKGKTYLASAPNIAQFTNGRFEPLGQLSLTAEPLVEKVDHPTVLLPPIQAMPEGDYLLLITPQDCRAETFISGTPAGVLGLLPPAQSRQSQQVQSFEYGAVADATSQFPKEIATVTAAQDWTIPLIKASQKAGTNQIVTAATTLGPVAAQLDAAEAELARVGINLYQHQRTYDILTWQYATKGFFKLKKKIPNILRDLGF